MRSRSAGPLRVPDQAGTVQREHAVGEQFRPHAPHRHAVLDEFVRHRIRDLADAQLDRVRQHRAAGVRRRAAQQFDDPVGDRARLPLVLGGHRRHVMFEERLVDLDDEVEVGEVHRAAAVDALSRCRIVVRGDVPARHARVDHRDLEHRLPDRCEVDARVQPQRDAARVVGRRRVREGDCGRQRPSKSWGTCDRLQRMLRASPALTSSRTPGPMNGVTMPTPPMTARRQPAAGPERQHLEDVDTAQPLRLLEDPAFDGVDAAGVARQVAHRPRAFGHMLCQAPPDKFKSGLEGCCGDLGHVGQVTTGCDTHCHGARSPVMTTWASSAPRQRVRHDVSMQGAYPLTGAACRARVYPNCHAALQHELVGWI